jgi:hypothetical protein
MKRKSGKKVKRKKKAQPSDGAASAASVETASNLMFEDPFEDEFAEEEIINGDEEMDETQESAPAPRVRRTRTITLRILIACGRFGCLE